MTMTRRVARWGTGRAIRRLSRSVPVLGTAVAIVAVGATIRRKGLFGGIAETVLNAIPFVGAAKNTAEAFRGGDFIPDKRPSAARCYAQAAASGRLTDPPADVTGRIPPAEQIGGHAGRRQPGNEPAEKSTTSSTRTPKADRQNA